MSDYQQYLQERDRIDYIIQMGYKITSVTEHLNGAYVRFEKKEGNDGEILKETLLISNANARKYFAVKFIQQQNSQV
jgi:histidinol phosphatase-like PHP family hydrolase